MRAQSFTAANIGVLILGLVSFVVPAALAMRQRAQRRAWLQSNPHKQQQLQQEQEQDLST